jgi:uroporphyrinogen III methyltransferase/synthase
VLLQPTIEILPPKTWEKVDAMVRDGSTFDWVLFSSTNGVNGWLERVGVVGISPEDPTWSCRIAAIGPSTARALERAGWKVDLVPETHYRAESLADLLSTEAKGRRFLQVRGSRGRGVLEDRLREAGGEVVPCRVYRSVDVQQVAPAVAEAYARGDVDWTTVTSPAIGRSLGRLLGGNLKKSRLAAISPLTAESLRVQGLEVTVTAREATMDSLTETIAAWEQGHHS